VKRPRIHFAPLALVYLVALLNLALTAFVSSRTSVPLETFFRDPTFTLDGHPLTGVQSNLNVVVWCAAAATCFFAAALLKQRGDRRYSFLFWSGVITAALMIDDFFLVHDDLAQRYLDLNDKLVLSLHGVALLAYLIVFKKVIARTELALLGLAFAFFGASTFIDVIQERWQSSWRIFFEDGFKLLGIVSWSTYLIRTGFQAVKTPAAAYSNTQEQGPTRAR